MLLEEGWPKKLYFGDRSQIKLLHEIQGSRVVPLCGIDSVFF